MSKPFSILCNKMSPRAQKLADEKTKKMLKDMALQGNHTKCISSPKKDNTT